MITSTICWPLQTCLYIRNIIVFQTSIHPAFLKKIRRSMKNYPSIASYSEDKPNVLLYGLSDLGKEKVASTLGDACCREQKSVFYITYDDFADIMKIHSGKPKPNKAHSSLLKTNCLIIGNFTETTIYDESILESMHRLLETRVKAHQNSYIQHKYNPKKAFTPL